MRQPVSPITTMRFGGPLSSGRSWPSTDACFAVFGNASTHTRTRKFAPAVARSCIAASAPSTRSLGHLLLGTTTRASFTPPGPSCTHAAAMPSSAAREDIGSRTESQQAANANARLVIRWRPPSRAQFVRRELAVLVSIELREQRALCRRELLEIHTALLLPVDDRGGGGGILLPAAGILGADLIRAETS